MSYDANGNITSLTRYGKGTLMDNLTISYTGNQPTSVSESASDNNTSGSFEYKKANGSGYIFNANGALVADKSRGIAYITYDLNNNPKQIYFTNGSVTKYVYSASGQKLRAVHYTAKPNITRTWGEKPAELTVAQILLADSTDYLMGGSLTMFGGGYAQASVASSTTDNFAFYYYNQDHLGNIREVVNESGTVQQVTNYYPFGAPYADASASTNSDFQPYKYNGKELDKMHGLNSYDYGARQHDPILCRWDRIDPLCEKYYSMSPYNYCGNSPINNIDPDGKKKHNWIKGSGRDNNASSQKRYENRYGNRFVQVWAHGNKESIRGKATGIEVEIDYYAPRIKGGGYYHSRSRESKIVTDAGELSNLLNKYDQDWSTASSGQAILILHSCATSEFAQEISGAKEFQDVIIIAPTENVHTSSNGDERIATTINEKTGEEIEGIWEVFQNGKPLLDESGKPITYPSNSQVGTKGFEYGF